MTRDSGNSNSRMWLWVVFTTVLAVAISSLAYLPSLGQIYFWKQIEFSEDVEVSTKLANLTPISTKPYTGCESIVYARGSLYTGTVQGTVLKINETGGFVFSKFGKTNCESPHECGRPLGIRLSHDAQQLIVADAYLGLYSVDLSDGSHKKLFPLDGTSKVTFFNDLDILPNGTILLSESSIRHSLEEIMHIVFEEEPSGRVISIDPVTGDWKELLGNSRFPNGVQLHRDGKSVLIAESGNSRILRLPLDGGRPTVFADNLPGIPDNVRMSKRGGYWVPVINLKGTFISTMLEYVHRIPILRRALLQVISVPFLRGIRNSKSTMVLRLNEDGKIIEVLRDPTGRVLNVAEVCEQDNVLFTGTYYLPHIGRLEL
ncbi:Adipocyte plasma membrane-associated protein [Paragonimus heterotremus]|uniref:Adipocyte plasma membrane-associated protein n=1 Tax=Paragonimus heterotremus TaxID=100268 RepID=A0A8J4T2R7_9TREM|nr:Adipocyte plasma membrane-associated protein [Paragonimus heterotremus]